MEITLFESAEAFERWLDEYHSSSPGIWLKLRKKAAGVVALDYAQALDVALCYGWIDGQKDKFDDSYWLQRFTPRRPKSKWSKINRDKAAALLEQGRMRPPGLAEVERAKPMAGGTPRTTDGGAPRYRTIWPRPSLATPPLQSSSRHWTARTDTRSCTASRTPRSPRPVRGGSRPM